MQRKEIKMKKGPKKPSRQQAKPSTAVVVSRAKVLASRAESQKDLIKQAIHLTPDPACAQAKTLAVHPFFNISQNKGPLYECYLELCAQLQKVVEEPVSHQDKILTHKKLFNLNYFFHQHVLKNRRIDDGCWYTVLHNLCISLNFLSNEYLTQISHGNHETLTAFLDLYPFIEDCFNIFPIFHEHLLTNTPIQVNEGYIHQVKPRLFEMLLMQIDLELSYAFHHAAYGNIALSQELTEKSLNALLHVGTHAALLSELSHKTPMQAAESIKKIRDFACSINNIFKKDGNAKILLSSCNALIECFNNDFLNLQPEIAFTDPRSSGSSHDVVANLSQRISEQKSFVEDKTKKTYFVNRITPETLTRLNTTLGLLNELFTAENHSDCHQNLVNALQLCLAWQKLFTFSYHEDIARPIKAEFIKITSKLIVHIKQLTLEQTSQFNNILSAAANIPASLDEPYSHPLSTEYPLLKPNTDFSYQLLEHTFANNSFSVDNYVETLTEAEVKKNLQQLQQKINTLQFLLGQVACIGIQNPHTARLIFHIWIYVTHYFTAYAYLLKHHTLSHDELMHYNFIASNYSLIAENYKKSYVQILFSTSMRDTHLLTENVINSILPHLMMAHEALILIDLHFAYICYRQQDMVTASKKIQGCYKAIQVFAHELPWHPEGFNASDNMQLHAVIASIRELVMLIYKPIITDQLAQEIFSLAEQTIPFAEDVTEIVDKITPEYLPIFMESVVTYLDFKNHLEPFSSINIIIENQLLLPRIYALFFIVNHTLMPHLPLRNALYAKALETLWQECYRYYQNSLEIHKEAPSAKDKMHATVDIDLMATFLGRLIKPFEQHLLETNNSIHFTPEQIRFYGEIANIKLKLQFQNTQAASKTVEPYTVEELDRLSKKKRPKKDVNTHTPSRSERKTKTQSVSIVNKNPNKNDRSSASTSTQSVIVPRSPSITSSAYVNTEWNDRPWTTIGAPKLAPQGPVQRGSSSSFSTQRPILISKKRSPKQNDASIQYATATTTQSSLSIPTVKSSVRIESKSYAQALRTPYQPRTNNIDFSAKHIVSVETPNESVPESVETLTQQINTLTLASPLVASSSVDDASRDLPTPKHQPETTDLLDTKDCPIIPGMISVSPDILDIYTRLTQRGYRTFIVGGYIRDAILGRVPNDVDFITTCPRDELPEIFDGVGSPNPNPGQEDHYRLHHGVDIMTTNAANLTIEALKRDVTINAFFYDLKHIYDPLNVLPTLYLNYLVVIGNTKDRFEHDLSIILRMIRFTNTLINKAITPSDFFEIQQHAFQIATMPWKTLMSNIRALFLRDCYQAELIYQYLRNNRLLAPLLTLNTSEYSLYHIDPLMNDYLDQYWKVALQTIYKEHLYPWKIPNKKILALILFIRLTGNMHHDKYCTFEKASKNAVLALQATIGTALPIAEKTWLLDSIPELLKKHHNSFIQFKFKLDTKIPASSTVALTPFYNASQSSRHAVPAARRPRRTP